MKPKHCLSDDAVSLSQQMFLKDRHWIAYNSLNYELGEGDIEFFSSKQQAKLFAHNNINDNKSYKIIYASSIMNLINQLSHGNSIGNVNDIDHAVKTSFMNEENLNYLKEDLKYLGFGDKLYANLEHNMRQGFPEFVLKTRNEFGSAVLESTLYFSKSKEDDRYFFNRHDAKLKNDVGTREQSFYVNRGHGVTLKEAFNLLEGRAVYKEMNPKEGERYHAWMQLDFKNKEGNGNYKIRQFHDNYGYDLPGVLSNFPIKELADQQRNDRLVMSLQKGNLQTVTMIIDGKEQKFSIHASPQYKSIDVYDYGAIRPLTNEEKIQLIIPEGRKKLNGKKVEGEQPGKELNQGNDKERKNELKNNGKASQRKGKRNGVKIH